MISNVQQIVIHKYNGVHVHAQHTTVTQNKVIMHINTLCGCHIKNVLPTKIECTYYDLEFKAALWLKTGWVVHERYTELSNKQNCCW